jgi:hypothetical protein
VWETYRLAGSLDGHLAAYRHPQTPSSVSTAAAAVARPRRTSILVQPARLSTPLRPTSGGWAAHHGVLAVVFTGLVGGDLVLPVRLPQGAGQWAHLSHFVADPSVWHKINLVRVRDRKAPGRWRYYAHLPVHQAGYQAPGTRARRAEIPCGRRAGVAGLPARVGGLSQPAPATNTTRWCWIGQDRQPPPGSTPPTPEQTRHTWTSRTQPKTTSPQPDWRCMTHCGVNS